MWTSDDAANDDIYSVIIVIDSDGDILNFFPRKWIQMWCTAVCASLTNT